MVIGRKVYCDFCFDLCLPDDFVSIQIEAAGQIHEFTFHNRHGEDCLARKLAQLKAQFIAPEV